MKKPSTSPKDEEAARRRFDALFDKAHTAGKRAGERDLAELRELLTGDYKLWKRIPGSGSTAIDYLLQRNIAGPAISEAWRARAHDFMDRLGKDAGPGERLLVEHLTLCWLQLNFIEMKYADVLGGGAVTLEQGRHWDRRVSLAQKRFMRAAEALERLRALSAAARYATARAEAAEAAKPEERPGPRALTA